MNKQRTVVLAIATIGMLATFMPWVNAPIIGSVNGTQGDGWITFFLFAIPLIISLLGNKTNKDWKRHQFIASIPCILAAVMGIWKMVDISSSMNDLGDNPFAETLSMGVSIGFGLYLIVLAGIALPIYLFINNRKQLVISEHDEKDGKSKN